MAWILDCRSYVTTPRVPSRCFCLASSSFTTLVARYCCVLRCLSLDITKPHIQAAIMRAYWTTITLALGIGTAFGLNSTSLYSNTTGIEQSTSSSGWPSSSSATTTSAFVSPHSSHSSAILTDSLSLSTASTGSSPSQSYFAGIDLNATASAASASSFPLAGVYSIPPSNAGTSSSLSAGYRSSVTTSNYQSSPRTQQILAIIPSRSFSPSPLFRALVITDSQRTQHALVVVMRLHCRQASCHLE